MEEIDKASAQDERRVEARRLANREATSNVNLKSVRRDLLLADRPAMLLALSRLASRSRSQFVLKSWRPV